MLDGNRKLFKYQKLEIKSWMSELYRVLKNGSHCYIFTNALNMKEMLNESEKAGFKLHNILVWEKNNCTPSQYYMKNCEYILFLRKGKAKYINEIGNSKTVHKFNNIIGKKLHPCEKPIDILKMYINNSSNQNDVVLDPFSGSFTTSAVAVKLNRVAVGIDMNEEYFEMGLRRTRITNEYKGKTLVKEKKRKTNAKSKYVRE